MGKISDLVQQQRPMTALFSWFRFFFFLVALDPQQAWVRRAQVLTDTTLEGLGRWLPPGL